MQHEGHIREFMQTGIDIASQAGHATPGGEASSADPVERSPRRECGLRSAIAGHAPLPTAVGAWSVDEWPEMHLFYKSPTAFSSLLRARKSIPL